MSAGDIDQVFLGLDKKLTDFKHEVGVEFLARVKQRTPVLTGQLRDSWSLAEHPNDIEIKNSAYYARFVEYGTVHMAPRAMLQTTLVEIDLIIDEAKKKAGL